MFIEHLLCHTYYSQHIIDTIYCYPILWARPRQVE